MGLEILVVDDDMGLRRSFAGQLEKDGFVVAEAQNGAQALERCKDHEFDVVLTDWEMPEMDGADLCRELKQLQEAPAVIIMSGGHTEPEAKQAGADMFTHKKPGSYANIVDFLDNLW